MERIDWQGVIVPRVRELIDSYSYRPTLRQVFYRLVAALLLPDTEVTYKSLSRATVLAREQEVIDPLCFDDFIRKPTGGDGTDTDPTAFVQERLYEYRNSPQYYARPLWVPQYFLPIIWLEKYALFTPVRSITRRYRIQTYVSRGYSSFTAIYEAAQEIAGYKPVKVLQLTDFDPSGEDMVRDLQTRLRRYGAVNFEVEKIALTHEQVSEKGLPPMPATTKDPRYDRFAQSYGDKAVELDALPPDELESILCNAIDSLIDSTAWNAELEQEKDDKQEATRQINETLAKPD